MVLHAVPWGEREECPVCYEGMGPGTGQCGRRPWRCHRHAVCERCHDVLLGGNHKCPICRADRLPAVPETLLGKLAFALKRVLCTLGSWCMRLVSDAALAVLGTAIIILIVQDVYLCRGGTFTLHFPQGEQVWDRELSATCALGSFVQAAMLLPVNVVTCLGLKFFWIVLIVAAGTLWLWAGLVMIVAFLFGLVSHEAVMDWLPAGLNATDAAA